MTGPKAVVHGRLIDGSGAQPIEDAALIVRDGRIEAVGAAAGIAVRFGKGAITRARVVHEGEVGDEDAESDMIDDDPLRRLQTPG